MQKFKTKGHITLMGDFNSRCGLNGDTVSDASGAELATFAELSGLELVNAHENLCSGKFTRVQKRTRLHADGTVMST